VRNCPERRGTIGFDAFERDQSPRTNCSIFSNGFTVKLLFVAFPRIETSFLELIDFLSTRPTAQQILTHKVSSVVQERLEELLDKNREEGLTTAEDEEMDAYRLVNRVMILLKARAHPTVSLPRSSLL
jgi:hypothetical protein